MPKPANFCAVRPSVAFGSTARRLPGWRADCPPGREIGFRPTTSGLPLETDIVRAGRHVSKVPTGDISRVARSPDPSYNISWVGLQAMVQKRPERVERRLSAILAADVAGYSRLMHTEEEATHARLTALLTDAVAPAIAEHGGRIVKNTGDGFLAVFPSAVQAVRAAVQFQTRIKELTIGDAEDRRIALRAGVNIGDVIVEPHDIFGDGVNIAARLEGIADPGGICISRTVLDRCAISSISRFEDAGVGTGQEYSPACPVAVSLHSDPGRSAGDYDG